jgi:hypothetical protein
MRIITPVRGVIFAREITANALLPSNGYTGNVSIRFPKKKRLG